MHRGVGRAVLALVVAVALAGCDIGEEEVGAEISAPSPQEVPSGREGAIPREAESNFATRPMGTVVGVAGEGVSVDSGAEQLLAAIQENEDLEVAYDVDFSDAAGAPTRLIAFGNPRHDTLLMQFGRSLGLDAPHRLLLFEDSAGTVRIVYDRPSYLGERHGVEGATELRQMFATTIDLTADLDMEDATELPSNVDLQEGVTDEITDRPFEESLSAVKSAAESRGLQLVQEVDHASRAESVAVDLPRTTLLMFEMPEFSRQTLAEQRAVGLDLPLRVMVWAEDDDTVHLSYTEPSFLASRHNVVEQDPLVRQVEKTLREVVGEVAGVPPEEVGDDPGGGGTEVKGGGDPDESTEDVLDEP